MCGCPDPEVNPQDSISVRHPDCVSRSSRLPLTEQTFWYMARHSNVNILGISAFYHDSAACLVRDGAIVAAASEERFSRVKGDPSFPERAVDYCLREAGLSVEDLDFVGFYDKPLLKFERILETYLGVAPRGFGSFLKAGPLWTKE